MDDKRVYLFDSTLRDGAQTQGVDFSVAAKCRDVPKAAMHGTHYQGSQHIRNPLTETGAPSIHKLFF